MSFKHEQFLKDWLSGMALEYQVFPGEWVPFRKEDDCLTARNAPALNVEYKFRSVPKKKEYMVLKNKINNLLFVHPYSSSFDSEYYTDTGMRFKL